MRLLTLQELEDSGDEDINDKSQTERKDNKTTSCLEQHVPRIHSSRSNAKDRDDWSRYHQMNNDARPMALAHVYLSHQGHPVARPSERVIFPPQTSVLHTLVWIVYMIARSLDTQNFNLLKEVI